MQTYNPNTISIYVHLPWCVAKCPYCDFNSYALTQTMPETAYVAELLNDIKQNISTPTDKKLISIYFGGGTPSLFSAASIHTIITAITSRFQSISSTLEITLETNPGTQEYKKFREYRDCGVNRLSIGIQSFNDTQLKLIGRIHDSKQSHLAIENAYNAGFTNINIDIMYGLPKANTEQSLLDLNTALAYQPTHLSWYQLTLEPNTYFYSHPPTLPTDDSLINLYHLGIEQLQKNSYKHYEVSAYCRDNIQSIHNTNYWLFGDYIGIGAGAHSKLTLNNQSIKRNIKHKSPKLYMQQPIKISSDSIITKKDLIFEFFLNRLRLFSSISNTSFTQATGLQFKDIQTQINQAICQGLLKQTKNNIRITDQGKLFLNNLQSIFLP